MGSEVLIRNFYDAVLRDDTQKHFSPRKVTMKYRSATESHPKYIWATIVTKECHKQTYPHQDLPHNTVPP